MTRLRLSSYIFFMNLVQLFFGKFFHIDEAVARSFDGPDDLIQLQMHGFTVTGLGILNQKHHKKCDDGRTGVDDELPCIAEMKEGPCKESN